MSNDAVPLAQVVSLFAILFVLGTLLTIPLFKFDLHKFVKSTLFIKIAFWIPIFIVFLASLYIENVYRLGLLVLILLAALFEIIRGIKGSNNKLITFYFIFFTIGMAHFALLATIYENLFVTLLITLCFATVLSDVAAFFMGNYLGKHKLPDRLNNNKSWEGVLGQVVGAFLGVILVNIFITKVPTLWIFLPIGIGSVAGDLINSYTKRQIKIKDWGSSLPGHGGFLDRFASFAGSAMLTFYYLKIL